MLFTKFSACYLTIIKHYLSERNEKKKLQNENIWREEESTRKTVGHVVNER